MVSLFEKVRQKGKVAEKYQFYYLNCLHLMAVAAFRNKRFAESQQLVNEIRTTIREGNAMWHSMFHHKCTLLDVLNLVYQGQLGQAIESLKGQQGFLNMQLLKVMCYFLNEEYQQAYEHVKAFQRSDDWYTKKVGWIWVLKKNLIEILLLIQLDKFDLVLHRTARFQRHFRKPLLKVGENRVISYVSLIKEVYETPEIAESIAFKEKVENSFHWVGRDREDVFVMTFYAWLKAKMENKTLYVVALELVGHTD